MAFLCIPNWFSVHLDSFSNEKFNGFRIRTLSLSDAVTLVSRDRIQFSASIPHLGGVSIIEPEAPGVLQRYELSYYRMAYNAGIQSSFEINLRFFVHVRHAFSFTYH